MTIGELIQRVQSLYSKGVQSDDSRLSSRHIYNKLLTVRSRLLSQQAKKKQKISQWNYQTIPCLKLIEAPINECPCLPPIGCKIYRSEFPLPEVMTDYNGHLIESVTSIDGSIIYDEITWKEKKYKSANRYTKNKPDYFIRGEKDKYIYITYKENATQIIALTALFENPLEAMSYIGYCDEDTIDCESPLDKNFPIDLDMVDALIEITVQELVLLFSQSIEDKTNDSKDSDIQQTK